MRQVLGVLIVGICALGVAQAGPVYFLNIDHCSGGCGGALSTVTLDGTVANQITVTVDLETGFRFIQTGAGGQNHFGFNLTGAAPTSVSITSVHPKPLAFRAGANWNDGFGDFDYSIYCPTCGNGAGDAFAGPLIFTVFRAGITVAEFEKLSTSDGAPPVFFAADVIAPAPPDGTGLTGLIGGPGDPGIPGVPEPMSLLLLGSGLVGIVSVLRFRKR